MKRSAVLHVLSRRELFAVAGCAGLTAVIAGCTDGTGAGIQTGPLGNSGSGSDGTPDAPAALDAASADAHAGGQDASTSTDASVAPSCSGTATDVGEPTVFVSDTPVYFSSGKFFVVRDAGGLYAVTAVCTHEGAICAVSSGDYRCPRHGALFQYDGTIISGPVSRELAHYSMCLLSNGHAGVTTTTCAKTQRLAV